MSGLSGTSTFNRPDRIVQGWYWALRSSELGRRKARPLKFLGRDLVVYRGDDGVVRALDAYCPHMGAHLAEGIVEGQSIRCLFHYWKFSSDGQCEEIPCQKATGNVPKIPTWPVRESYGLIWIHAGDGPEQRFPLPPELEGLATDSRLAHQFVKECHPNVMMINAIDAQHFNSVHELPVELDLEPSVHSRECIEFKNTTSFPKDNPLRRFLSRFYAGRLTYDLCYWFGSTGSVSLGPDFLHFYILFALRPTAEGRSEGQTILLTRARPGILGRILNPIILLATQIVGNYFAKGDTLIFKSIKFDFKTPVKADHSIIRFIQHLESQRTLEWGSWKEPVEAVAP